MIKLEHLNKTFSSTGKTFHAVNDVNLEINKGEIFGIIGFSGAGKSTLVKKKFRLLKIKKLSAIYKKQK